jgi:hypothetical protein
VSPYTRRAAGLKSTVPANAGCEMDFASAIVYFSNTWLLQAQTLSHDMAVCRHAAAVAHSVSVLGNSCSMPTCLGLHKFTCMLVWTIHILNLHTCRRGDQRAGVPRRTAPHFKIQRTASVSATCSVIVFIMSCSRLLKNAFCMSALVSSNLRQACIFLVRPRMRQ